METRVSLLLRLKDPRDSRAWSEFDAIYRPMLLRFARSQGLLDADAEDEVQRCMAAIQQIMGDFTYDPRKGRFKGWLRTMINNRCRNYHRDRKVRQEHMQTKAEQDERHQETPDEAFDRIWKEEHLKYGMRMLRAEIGDQRFKAFEEYAIKGRPAKEVCAELGLNPNQLHKIKHQSVRKLRDCITAVLRGRGSCLSAADLHRYLVKELPPEEASRVAAHLEACAACAEKNERILANQERICSMLRGLDARG